VTFAVHVDAADPTPPYEQLRRQLADAIGAGVLPEGTRLPPVRQLAGDLGLAPGTVMRAYGELAATGLVVTGRARGTVVAAVPPMNGPDVRQRLDDLARAYVAEARRWGASGGDTLAAVERALGTSGSAV